MEEEAAYYSNVITITNRNRNVLTVIQKVICGFYEGWFRLLQSGPDFMEKYLLCRLLKNKWGSLCRAMQIPPLYIFALTFFS